MSRLRATSPEDVEQRIESIWDKIDNGGGGGGGYVLPIASSDTLGGVKVGENLSITGEGVLSVNAGFKVRTLSYIGDGTYPNKIIFPDYVGGILGACYEVNNGPEATGGIALGSDGYLAMRFANYSDMYTINSLMGWGCDGKSISPYKKNSTWTGDYWNTLNKEVVIYWFAAEDLNNNPYDQDFSFFPTESPYFAINKYARCLFNGQNGAGFTKPNFNPTISILAECISDTATPSGKPNRLIHFGLSSDDVYNGYNQASNITCQYRGKTWYCTQIGVAGITNNGTGDIADRYSIYPTTITYSGGNRWFSEEQMINVLKTAYGDTEE